jgi:tetratricopeptide (TPR) repeat protein
LGEASGKNGETAEALEMFARAQAVLEEIQRLDPKNRETKFDLLIIYESFGALYRARKEYGKAAERYEKVIALDTEIYSTDPQKIEALKHLGRSCATLAEIAEEMGEPSKAAAYRQKAAGVEELYRNKTESLNQK